MGPKAGTLAIFLLGLTFLSDATPFLQSSLVSSSTNIKTKISATLLLLGCISLCYLIKKRAALKQKDGKDKIFKNPAADEMGEKLVHFDGPFESKLVHFDGPLVFTADDLLRSTTEVVREGPYYTECKATLEGGSEISVKRMRGTTTKGAKEFVEEATTLGKIRPHANLLPLRAYYLGPEEKVLIFDQMSKGSCSLSTFLHARGPETLVPWDTRMKIAKGISRGLAHLHDNENMIHENLTTRNIFLDDEKASNVLIADYGLSRLMTSAAATNMMETAGGLGYRAPECVTIKNASTKSDVYNLGVIMLELLTGKCPGEQTNWVGLPQFVASVLKGDWTNEAFDVELVKEAETVGYNELLGTLNLALNCVVPSPAARPEAIQVVNQLEKLKPEK